MRKIVLALLTAFLAVSAALAGESVAPAVKRALEGAVPGQKPDRISATPIPGVFELTFGAHVVYVSQDGRYLLNGDVIDLMKQENITEPKRKQARVDAINALGEASMIVFAAKQPKYTVSVFTDVTCPYCQQFHRDMDELNALGVTVRYLAFPRSGIPSQIYDSMVSVWCADDPQQAMTDAKTGKDVAPKTCKNPVAEHYRLGREIGVSGTPSLVLETGAIVPGYVPPQRLVQTIEAERARLVKR